MNWRHTLLRVLTALGGIAVAAAITLGTSQLVRQHIGLSSEPLTAGHRLLPSITSAAQPRHTTRSSSPPKAQRTTPSTRLVAPAAPATEPREAPRTTIEVPRSADKGRPAPSPRERGRDSEDARAHGDD